jgi:hypothetical protein
MDDLPPHIKPGEVCTITVGGEHFERACETIYLRLGSLLVQANTLENIVFELYWVVTQRPMNEVLDEAKGWTLGTLVPKFIDAFRRGVKDTALVLRLQGLEPELRACVVLRNEYIHASWSVSAEGWAQRTSRPRVKGRPAYEQCLRMNPAHIEAAADRLGELTWALYELWDDVVSAMGGRLPPQLGEMRDGASYPHAREYRDLTK